MRGVLISLGMRIPADAGSAKTSAFAYADSGTCLESPEGFNSKLEPVNSGVAWTTTFNAAGTADANGNVTEFGQSVDSASFGVGPRMHMPAADAYEDTFSFTVTEPDGDGNVTLHVGALSGTFTAGPNRLRTQEGDQRQRGNGVQKRRLPHQPDRLAGERYQV